MSENDIPLDAAVHPPETVLTAMLTVFQDLFHKNPTFQMMSEVEVLAKLLNEQGNEKQIQLFIESYLDPTQPNAYDNAIRGMAVMATLGYMYGKGEKNVRRAFG